jgi:hypothetical protein
MRNLLAFLSAATLTFFGLGWYLGWYQLHSGPAVAGHRSVTIDINTVKIGDDLERGGQKLHAIIDKAGKDAEPKDKDGPPNPKETRGHEAVPLTPALGEWDIPTGAREIQPATPKKGKEGAGRTNFWLDGFRK